MVKISIIVPIYNVEKYLHRCLDSLVNQTLKDIEIILINDASPDRSDIIMEEYRKKYPDIIKCIYLTENMHQGGARNKGIEIAKGKYIMFVDSDDWVDETICEKLYEKSEQGTYDIVGCDYYNVDEITGMKSWNSMYFNQQTGIMDDIKKASLIYNYPVCWAKMIKRDLLVDNQLYFPSHMKYEDCAIVPLYYIYAKTFNFVEEPLYYYYVREDSTCHKLNSSEHMDNINANDMIYKEFKNRDITGFNDEVDALYFKYTCNVLRKLVTFYDKLDIDNLIKLEEILNNLYPECMNNRYYYSLTTAFERKIAELLYFDKDSLLEQHENNLLKERDLNYLTFYEKFKDNINEILEYCRKKQYRVAIWGAGLKGSDFLTVIDPDRDKVSLVIDMDERKHGSKTRSGHPVTGFTEAANQVDFVIVMNKKFYASIKDEIKKVNQFIHIFNLELYLLMKKIQLEQCIE